MRVLDLFSGIGGFSLGLERTSGFRTVAFCEVDPFCRRVLAKHWPEVPCYDDVRTLTADRLAADGIGVDVICGGFPCQDISVAGKGAGLTGERSGLWREYARLIGEIRPRYVLVENVAALLGRGLGDVLGDLASLGFDAEWHCIPASAIGAPHRRDRIWIVAYPGCVGGAGRREPGDLAVATGAREADCQEWQRHGDATDDSCAVVAHASCKLSHGSGSVGARWRIEPPDIGQNVPHADCSRLAQRESVSRDDGPKLTSIVGGDWWLTEPDVGRVANGISARVDRLRSLGNTVVPQIPELIGRAILAAPASRRP